MLEISDGEKVSRAAMNFEHLMSPVQKSFEAVLHLLWSWLSLLCLSCGPKHKWLNWRPLSLYLEGLHLVGIRLLHLVQSRYICLSGQEQRGHVKGTSTLTRYSDMWQGENQCEQLHHKCSAIRVWSFLMVCKPQALGLSCPHPLCSGLPG